MSKVKMAFVLEWDAEELGSGWMNIDNLRSCLYGENCTTEELCQVRELPQVNPQHRGVMARTPMGDRMVYPLV